MSAENQNMDELLAGASLNIDPNPQRMQAVQACMRQGGRPGRTHSRATRAVGCGALLLAGVATAGLAGTQAGRNWVRQIVAPIYKSETVEIPGAPDPATPGAFTVTTVGRSSSGGDAQPFTPEEKAAISADMVEVQQIRRAGGGRLTSLLEGVGPDGGLHTVFLIEYTLAGGKQISVGESKRPLASLNVDELLQLRDSGAGELVSSEPFPIGLGRYTIRFTLVDGAAIDLETNYPPGTRAEREAIIAETRQLKTARRFTVDQANSSPDGEVWGTLRYTLGDGRQVGVTEQVPADTIAPDGRSVITTETGQDQPPAP